MYKINKLKFEIIIYLGIYSHIYLKFYIIVIIDMLEYQC